MPLRTHPLPLISFLPSPHYPILNNSSTLPSHSLLLIPSFRLPSPLLFPLIIPFLTHQTSPLHTCLPFFTFATTPTSHGSHYTSFTPSLTLPTHLLSPLLTPTVPHTQCSLASPPSAHSPFLTFVFSHYTVYLSPLTSLPADLEYLILPAYTLIPPSGAYILLTHPLALPYPLLISLPGHSSLRLTSYSFLPLHYHLSFLFPAHRPLSPPLFHLFPTPVLT